MSSVLCYDIHICDLVFLVTLSKRMMKRQYVIKTKTIVSVLTFLRSSQGIVGWGGGGRQMDGGTDKWDRGQVFLIASLLFVLGFLIQLCVDFCDLFVFVLLIASLFFVPGFLIQLRLDFFDIVQSICICASNCLPLVCAWISYQTLFGFLLFRPLVWFRVWVEVRQDFEAGVWLVFWLFCRWYFVEVMKLNLSQSYVWSIFCILSLVEMLMFGWDFELRERVKKNGLFLGKSPKLWVGGGQES